MDLLILILIFSALEGVLSFVGYSVSQSSVNYAWNGATNAVDNDMTSCAITKTGAGEYWKIQFNQSLTVAGVSLMVNGGNYTIQVQNQSSEYSSQHVCSDAVLPFPFSFYNKSFTCTPNMYGNTILINRTNYGQLKLCIFRLKVCEANNLDIPCTKCTPESNCRSCDGSHYSVWCDKECSPGCVPGTCEELNGACKCREGYRSSPCHITERCSSVCANCFSSCTECDVLNQKCTACQESKFGDLCQLDCPQHCKTCNINNGTCLECKPGHGGDNCTET